jgi:cytoskeletal protein CcmA (bactofilin family)
VKRKGKDIMALFGGKSKDDENKSTTSNPQADNPTGATGKPRTETTSSFSPFKNQSDSSIARANNPHGSSRMANIGKSITIQGDLTGNEDLVIEGTVKGRVELPNNQLTIGEGGKLHAELNAKSVVIVGNVNGNVNASERVEIHGTGVVNGDVRTPRLIVQEGAVINGSVEMTKADAKAGASTPPLKAEQRKAV